MGAHYIHYSIFNHQELIADKRIVWVSNGEKQIRMPANKLNLKLTIT